MPRLIGALSLLGAAVLLSLGASSLVPGAVAAEQPNQLAETRIWNFSAGNLNGFYGFPSNGASNIVSWDPVRSSDGDGAIQIDVVSSVGRNSTVTTRSIPKRDWTNIITLTADVMAHTDICTCNIAVGIAIGPNPLPDDVEPFIHRLNSRGAFERMSWPVRPGQLQGANSFTFIIKSDQPLRKPMAISNIRAVPAGLTVDLSVPARPFDPGALYGTNIAYYYDPAFLNDSALVQLVKNARITTFRIPGGLNSDVYHWNGNGVTNRADPPVLGVIAPNNVWPIDYSGWAPGFEVTGETATGDPSPVDAPNFSKRNTFVRNSAIDVAQLAEWVRGQGPGTQMIVTTNVGTASQLQISGDKLTEADVELGAREAAEWVRFYNQTKGYGVKYWEVGNEYSPITPEIGAHIRDNSARGWHWMFAREYATIFRAYAKAMKAVDPAIKMAGPVGYYIAPAFADQTGSWIQSFLAEAGDLVDVLDIHFYENGTTVGEYLAQPAVLAGQLETMRGWIKAIRPDRVDKITFGVSEWSNYDDSFPVPDGLFAADMLGVMTTQPNLSFANTWDLQTMLRRAPDGSINPTGRYWALHMYANYFGTASVKASIGNVVPDRVGAYASINGAGQLSIVVINKDPMADLVLPITVNGYVAAPVVHAYSWGRDTYQWERGAPKPSVNTGPKESLVPLAPVYSFPPYSVTILRFDPAPSAAKALQK